jgi:hypothetical protein
VKTTGRHSDEYIEITPEMIAAGVAVLCASNAEDIPEHVVSDILAAALEAGGYVLKG